MIQEAIYTYERQLTDEIKQNKSKRIWTSINKLRGISSHREEVKVYDEEGSLLQGESLTKEMTEAWSSIYRMHNNNIKEVWNETRKCEYINSLTMEVNLPPTELREHIYTWTGLPQTLRPMKKVEITIEKVKNCLRSLKIKKSAGVDGLKPEMYKCFIENEECLEGLRKCLECEIRGESRPQSWKHSRTTMVKKKRKPTVRDFRPIAVLNVSFKILMALLKNEIEEHIKENNEAMEEQAGFTGGGRVDDNLLLLQYCVDDSYRRRKPLVVVSIDFKKAYDSIKREEMIQVMKEYRIHPEVIDILAEVYQGDSTKIRIEGEEINMQVTSGIKQGCTCSTTLFKLITYVIIKEIQKSTCKFQNEFFTMGALFYADDGLLLSNTVSGAREGVDILTRIAGKFGLEINKSKEKSSALIFNMKDHPNDIQGIEVEKTIKYLGITVENKRDMFGIFRKKVVEKAQKMANIVYPVISRSCNKLLIGKTFWKSVALPYVLYGCNAVDLNEDTIKKLQVIENGVCRKLMGAPRGAAVCTLRGEIGISEMKMRCIEGRLKYVNNIEHRGNGLLRAVKNRILEVGKMKWGRTTLAYLRDVECTPAMLNGMTAAEVKVRVREVGHRRWKEEVKSKATLTIYEKWKEEIKEETVYDNTPASVTFYAARANCLKLNDRRHHGGMSVCCEVCGAEREDLQHFLLECPGLQDIRGRQWELQRPYIEDKERIIGYYLFEGRNIEEKKSQLYKMWKQRERLIRSLQR